MKSLLIVCGVRPQYIKARALLYELRRSGRDDVLANISIFDTRQHYDIPLRTEALKLAESAKVFAPSGTESVSMGAAIDALCSHLSDQRELPSATIVFGDASPSLVGAVASTRFGVPVLHIEAGARRDFFEIEDCNSRMVDSIAAAAFCVSQNNVSVLRGEGFRGKAIWTGDLAYSYMLNEVAHTAASAMVTQTVESMGRNNYVLITIHRPSNSDPATLKHLLDTIRTIATPFIWITHPRNEEVVRAARSSNVHVLPPLPHRDVVELVQNAAFLLTDSGGLIREASLLGKRSLVLGTNGGWPELLENGTAIRAQVKEIKLAIKLIAGLAKDTILENPLVNARGISALLEGLHPYLDD